MRSMRSVRIATPALVLLGLAGCSWSLLRGYAEAPSAVLVELARPGEPVPAVTRFAFDDLGALNTDAMDTHAVPWKVLVAALLVDRRRHDGGVPLREEAVLPILQEFGFILPDTILNMGAAPQPNQHTAPLGLLRGIATRTFPRIELEISNLGCASCHAGVMYDAVGSPLREAWLGLPNTSLNLDALSRSLYRALVEVSENPAYFRAAVDSIYPDMSGAERRTLHDHVLPGVVERLPDSRDRWGALTPYAPGGAGNANGVGAVRHVLGLVGSEDRMVGVGGAVATPDLGDRMLRSSFASDGSFGVPGEPRFRALSPSDLTPEHLDAKAGVVAFFTVTTMGVKPDRVEPIVPRVRAILDFLRDYRPPPFPGVVDLQVAGRGEMLFSSRCASCHGEYRPIPEVRLERYPNVVVPVDRIGTDPVRWLAADPALADAIQGSAAGRFLSVGPTDGYAAPPLTGLWATAPYLHNGSVPTLWHFMHPEQRPERFEVGGHRLDFEMLGIDGDAGPDGTYVYPDGYEPWSSPAVYDTTLPGQANVGHEAPFQGLSENDKRALIEYLKLL